MTPVAIASLPDLSYLIPVCIVVAVIGLIGLAVILGFMRSFRKELAAELKREMEQEREPSPVAIQSPLEIKAHVGFVTLDKHSALAKDMDELKEQRRKDVAGLHVKIEQGIDGVRKDIAMEFKEVREDMADRREDIAKLQTETVTQTRQLHNMDNKIDRLLERSTKQ